MLYPQAQVQTFHSGQALRQYLDLAPRTGCDLVLLDLSVADDDGFSLLDALFQHWGWTTVLVLSESERPEDMMRAIDAGVMAFLPKRLRLQEMRQALTLATSGAVFVPPTLSPGATVAAEPSADTLPPDSEWADLGLTPRQVQVLRLLCDGCQNKDIARRLNLSVDTVKAHVATLLRIFQVSTRAQAVQAVTAYRQRLWVG